MNKADPEKSSSSKRPPKAKPGKSTRAKQVPAPGGPKHGRGDLEVAAAVPKIQAWHVVTGQDTPASITQKYFGVSYRAIWMAIYEVNAAVIGADPNEIQPGMQLSIPELPAAAGIQQAMAPEQPQGEQVHAQHTVAAANELPSAPKIKAWHVTTSQDTPTSIMRRFYGSDDKSIWMAIYEINSAVVGPDPKAGIQPGMLLSIPELPAATAIQQSGAPELSQAQQGPASNLKPGSEKPAPALAIRAWRVVTNEDTPTSVMQKYYGVADKRIWMAIYEINKAVIGPDPDRIRPGMLLSIPYVPVPNTVDEPLDTRRPQPQPTAPPDPKPSIENPDAAPKIIAWHVTTSQDTPASIMRKYYGATDQAIWRAIYEFNKAVIGADPNRIRPGLLLRIPDRHTATSSSLPDIREEAAKRPAAETHQAQAKLTPRAPEPAVNVPDSTPEATCPSCGSHVEPAVRYCVVCGADIGGRKGPGR